MPGRRYSVVISPSPMSSLRALMIGSETLSFIEATRLRARDKRIFPSHTSPDSHVDPRGKCTKPEYPQRTNEKSPVAGTAGARRDRPRSSPPPSRDRASRWSPLCQVHGRRLASRDGTPRSDEGAANLVQTRCVPFARRDRRAHDLPHVQLRARGHVRAKPDHNSGLQELIQFHQAAPEKEIRGRAMRDLGLCRRQNIDFALR